MNRLPLKLVLTTLACYAAGFIFYFALSVNHFSSQSYEMIFRTGWIIDNTLIRLITNITAFTCSAIVITYSFFYRGLFTAKDSRNPSGPFYKLVVKSLVIILILTLALSLAKEILIPQAMARQFERRELTQISREIYRKAETEESRGNYSEAYRLYKQYIEVFPDFREDMDKIQARLEYRLAENPKASQAVPAAETGARRVYSPRELLERAQNYAQEEDYFSAYYYSSMAFRLDSSLADAREYATRMWSMIENSAPVKEETLRSRIFDQKKAGTSLLASGKPVEAFYTFLELQDFITENHLPRDPDVETYINLAKQDTQSVTFFTRDAEALAAAPGYRDLFFLNTPPQDNTQTERELVFFGKAVPHSPSPGSWMVENFALIRWDSRGILYSIQAPYAKVQFFGGNEIILQGIDPDTRKTFSSARYLEGRSRPPLPDLIPLNTTQEQLNIVAEESQDYRMTSLSWLMSARKAMDSLGLFSWPLEQRILEKVLFPFSFLVLSLLALTMGWRLRWRPGASGRKNIAPAYWLLLPVLPFFFIRLTEFYNSVFLLLLQFVLSLAGFTMALITLLVSQGILLVLSFVLLAGQSNR